MIKFLDPITKVLNTALGLMKDTKGKLSSKRTISGIIIMTASADMTINGITTHNLILTAIGIIPVLFAMFEKPAK